MSSNRREVILVDYPKLRSQGFWQMLEHLTVSLQHHLGLGTRPPEHSPATAAPQWASRSAASALADANLWVRASEREPHVSSWRLLPRKPQDSGAHQNVSAPASQVAALSKAAKAKLPRVVCPAAGSDSKVVALRVFCQAIFFRVRDHKDHWGVSHGCSI